MARTRPEEQDPTVEGTEPQVETQATEAAPQATEAAPTEAAATPPAEVDLTAFQAAVEAVIGSATAAGDVSPEALEGAVSAYRDLDGAKGKNAAQKYLRELVGEHVKNLDMVKAKATVAIDDAIKAAGSKKKSSETPAKPVDPTEAYLAQRLTLDLARGHLPIPEGVAADVEDQVNAKYGDLSTHLTSYLTWFNGDKETRGDEPSDTDPIVRAAAKLLSSSSKGSKKSSGGGGGSKAPFTGTRRNIKTHIAEAFAGQPAGTFLKVAEIAKFSSAEYGDDHPSQGAISSSLGSAKFDVEGVRPDEQNGAKGAVKL